MRYNVRMDYVFGDARLPARIWAKIREPERPGECWFWTAAMANGYGYVYFEGRNHNAHRAVYMALVDHDIKGLDVDHLCHGVDEACAGGRSCLHRACVNPAHLEAVPPAVNKLRGRSPLADHARKTHCPKGHPLSGDNLWMDSGARICRICKKAKNQEWRDRNPEQVRNSDRAYRESLDPEVLRQRNREASARYRAKRKAGAPPAPSVLPLPNPVRNPSL